MIDIVVGLNLTSSGPNSVHVYIMELV